jgi:hypothetical protein
MFAVLEVVLHPSSEFWLNFVVNEVGDLSPHFRSN